MKLAFAGAGMISVIHAMAAEATNSPILAVASRTAARAQERADQVGATPVAFHELPAGADAVVVCTPPDRHATDLLALIQSGVVVLVEKPLASTLTEADAVVAAGGNVVYAENLAFSPLVIQTHELMGSLGALRFVEIRQLSPLPTWGDFLEPARGGGALFDLGSHAIALALLFAGADAATSVQASLEQSSDIEVDDYAEVFIDFVSGLRVRIEISWRHPDALWDIQLSGDSGVVRTELMPRPDIELNGGHVELTPLTSDMDLQLENLGYVGQMRTLRDVVEGAASPIDAKFGRRVLDVICAAYASAGTGGRPEALPFTGPRDRTPHSLWRG
ncbi:MAG: Gfo/Idh/MocA family oxidoreductase [Acidimicrobiales bacterium]